MEKDKKQIELHLRNITNGLKRLYVSASVGTSDMPDKEKIKNDLIKFIRGLNTVIKESGGNIDEILKNVEQQNKTKRQFERFKEYFLELKKCYENGFIVLSGSQETMINQLGEYIQHAENLWNEAESLYVQNHFSTSCFLAIACIEECAKISYGEFQVYFSQSDAITKTGDKTTGKNPLNKHNKKHFIAACSGALINSRLDRILGIKNIEKFIDDCQTGKLEKLRQTCLYADLNNIDSKVIPEKIITKKQSLFYVILAGELLSQIEGSGAIVNGFQEKLEKFEHENTIK